MSRGGMRQSSRVRSESFASLHFGQNQRSLPSIIKLVNVFSTVVAFSKMFQTNLQAVPSFGTVEDIHPNRIDPG